MGRGVPGREIALLGLPIPGRFTPLARSFEITFPYYIIRNLYDVFVQNSVREPAQSSRSVSVHEVGEWAGYLSFEQDETWHFSVASVTTDMDCATYHFRQALRLCDNRLKKGQILNFWANWVFDAIVLAPEEDPYTDECWQYTDEMIRCMEATQEVDHTFGCLAPTLSEIYFRRYLFRGSLDDLNKLITIEECVDKGPSFLGIYLQARWIQTRLASDFDLSAQHLEAILYGEHELSDPDEFHSSEFPI
jgi:hypothetical protein